MFKERYKDNNENKLTLISLSCSEIKEDSQEILYTYQYDNCNRLYTMKRKDFKDKFILIG